MKLLIELDIEVDGKISEERLRDVAANYILGDGHILSESHVGDDAYFISINSVEVKEVMLVLT